MDSCADCVNYCKAIKTKSGEHILRRFSDSELFDAKARGDDGVCKLKFLANQGKLFPVAHSIVLRIDSCYAFESNNSVSNHR